MNNLHKNNCQEKDWTLVGARLDQIAPNQLVTVTLNDFQARIFNL